MEREFKFRYYDPSIKAMLTPSCVGEFGFYSEDRDFEDGKSLPFDRLMQYVGLKDKNGKEIYESDILEDSSGNRWVVEWYNDHACFGVRCETVFSEIIDNLNMRVIGNIYSNPELINKATS